MALVKSILIVCPQYRITVPGTYEYSEDSSGRAGHDGKHVLDRVRCSQHDRRCMQTLCVLHRYNKRGPGSWYPEVILTSPPTNPSRQAGKADTPSSKQNPDGSSFIVDA